MELLKQQATIERFVASNQMGVLIEMIGSVVTLSVLEILRNATFIINEDDGTMSLEEINKAFDLMHEGKSIRSVIHF